MQIYVVSPGDTLYRIAHTYETTIGALTGANELDASNDLVIGQALVIPIIGEFYFVRQGDTLETIAQMFSFSQEELAEVNDLTIGIELPIGLKLYIPDKPKPPVTSNAYIQPGGDTVSETLVNSAAKSAPFLTYLSPFSYIVNRDGTLQNPPLDDFQEIADANDTSLMMAVTNMEEGTFSTELAQIILNVQAVQETLLETIIGTAREVGYLDIHFDFEYVRPEDRDAYTRFLRKARDRFHQEGLMLSTALAPKTSADQQGLLYEAHDYKAHGEIADMVVIMTYEWGYGGGPAQAVSPLPPVREVIEYALTEMPADKILMGQNLYGYDWTLPFEEGEEAPALSPQRAITLAREENVAIEYDTTAQAPFFMYYDTEGNEHEVWFEDARSIQAKFDLIIELGLLGISYWKLGLAFPQNWLLLGDNFMIKKLR